MFGFLPKCKLWILINLFFLKMEEEVSFILLAPASQSILDVLHSLFILKSCTYFSYIQSLHEYRANTNRFFKDDDSSIKLWTSICYEIVHIANYMTNIFFHVFFTISAIFKTKWIFPIWKLSSALQWSLRGTHKIVVHRSLAPILIVC